MQVRADSVNESERSIEAVLVTENPVPVYDWERGQFVDEILTMAGMRAVDQVPLLDNHSRWSLDDVFGSIRNIRVERDELVVRLFFADLSGLKDDSNAKEIERAWTKVKQRHQREVSAGYRVFEATTIPAGQSDTIRGKRYTAGRRPLRVATDWIVREGSLTPVAADQSATTRSEETTMNPLLRYLITIGLRADATVAESWSFVSALTDPGQRTEVRRIIDTPENGLTPPDSVRAAMTAWTAAPPVTPPAGGTGGSGQRTEPTNPPAPTAPDVQELVRSQLVLERQRSAELTRMFQESGVDNPPLLTRAIAEGWDSGRTAVELLPLVRQRASAPVDADGHIGIHVRGPATAESLSLAIMLRTGKVPLDYAGFSTERARTLAPAVLRRDINDDVRQRAMDQAHQLNQGFHHWLDVCRMALIVAGKQVPHDTEDMVRAAFSSSVVQDIFTSDINSRILRSYQDAPDTTDGWTRTEERSDFKINEGITMGKFGALTVHGPGKTADHLDVGTEKYSYRLFRYSGKFVIDEMDMINDRFGALEQHSPEDIGNSAAQIRPNLAYARLLANATFNGLALFHASRGNLFSGAGDALGITSVENAEVAMSDQRIRNRPLNLPLNFLLLPRQLKWRAKQLLNSSERRDNTANLQYGTANTLAGEEINWLADSRLGTGGCIDPETGLAYTGTATNWYATSSPGVNGAKTLVFGYRTGTNRAPKVRKYMLSEGTWGVGWDINLDIGCGVEDFRGMQRHVGQ
jgi:hypothetical protein